MSSAAPQLRLRHPDLDRILASLAKRGVIKLDAVAVAGSGLAGLASELCVEIELAYAEIDGYPTTKIPGHPGKLFVGLLHGRRTAVFAGRVHLYEGASGAQVTLPVQIAAALGARVIVLTSSVGAINPSYEPGDIMLVEDHLNLTQPNPLFAMTREAAENPFGGGAATPFIDLSHLYRTDLFGALQQALSPLGVCVHLGVLAALPGPNFETPAEVRMLRMLGADAVCMSTAPEALYARYAGLDVVALTLVTNVAHDGRGGEGPSHAEVLAQASAAGPNFARAAAEALRLAGDAA